MAEGHWIRCGALIDGTGRPPVLDALIRVEGRQIAAVERGPARTGSARALDLSGCTVCPGFIDAHVHLVFTYQADHASTRVMAEDASPAQLALTAAGNAIAALRAGITTVRDCGDIGYVTVDLRDAIARGAVPGPRILACGPPLTTGSGHLHWCGNSVASMAEIRAATQALCARGVDAVKVMASGGNMTVESDRLAAQFTVEEIRAITDVAHRAGRTVAAHAANTESIRRSVAAEVDTIEHCYWRGPGGEPEVDWDTVKEMATRRIAVDLTIAGPGRMLLPDAAVASGPERDAALDLSPSGSLFGDYEWAREMRHAGVPMLLSSDAGTRFTSFADFALTMRCAMEALGVTLSEAVAMVSWHAADALGIGAEVGAVAPGMRADLTVLRGVADERTTTVGEVVQVWREGRIVIDGGLLTQ
jgi:imidazolonepropionase-like amidohydrolase